MMIYLDVDFAYLNYLDGFAQGGMEGNRTPNFSMYVNYVVFTYRFTMKSTIHVGEI